MLGCDGGVREDTAIDRTDRYWGVLCIAQVDFTYAVRVGENLSIGSRRCDGCRARFRIEPATRLSRGKRKSREEFEERSPLVC